MLRTVILGLIGVLLLVGLVLQPAFGGSLEPMNQDELSEVRGKAPSEAIERVAQATKKYELFQRMDGKQVEENMRVKPEEIILKKMQEQNSPGAFVTMPISLIASQLSQSSVMFQPEARKVISNEAFQETMKITGSMAKVFSNF
jgi:hypothetical protein